MSNIQFLQSEIDQNLDGVFTCYQSVTGGGVDIHDSQGSLICSLDHDEATIEAIEDNDVLMYIVWDAATGGKY